MGGPIGGDPGSHGRDEGDLRCRLFGDTFVNLNGNDAILETVKLRGYSLTYLSCISYPFSKSIFLDEDNGLTPQIW